jgi:hypothetical protein
MDPYNKEEIDPLERVQRWDEMFVTNRICLDEKSFSFFLPILQVCRVLVANVVHL